jgi:membrane associated rhomboid family serine protease
VNDLSPRVTPWVVRLLAANAVILLLQQTVFTSAQLADLLAFNSQYAAERPWTFVTYMFVHAGLWHLAANSLALFVFGPTVERRLGSRIFIIYYLYCGIGAAIFSLLLRTLDLGAAEFVGASGAILGVAYAFARLTPDAQMMVFPIPVPIRARTLIMMLAAFDLVGLLFLSDGIAHGAHLGGLLSGGLYFVLRGIARPAEPAPLSSPRRRIPVVTSGGDGGRARAVTPQGEPASSPGQLDADRGRDEAAAIDRVLDKISASGLGSLTAEERRFLDSVARRRRDSTH